MANDKERELDLLMQPSQNTPCQHVPVLVLAGTVVCMTSEEFLSEAVVLKVVMEHADDGIRPLPCVDRLINEVVHLSSKHF